MHASDILKYGHYFIVQAVEGLELDNPDWDISGACGVWSMREIISHLASFEHLLIDILQTILGSSEPTPTIQIFMEHGGLKFNDIQIEMRKDQSVSESWAEYETTFVKSSELFKKVPEHQLRESGILAFYGDEYDLEDFIVYTYYGHKREHGAQINAFRDILNQRNRQA